MKLTHTEKCIVGMVGLFLVTTRNQPKSDYWNYWFG